MEPGNQKGLPVFLLLELSEKPQIKSILLLLCLYLLTFAGNLFIILATSSDLHLHTPIHFLLSNSSFSEIYFTSTTLPKMLLNIQMQNKVIIYVGCIMQMYFLTVFGLSDYLLLSAVAYGCFMAVHYPLHYKVIMNPCLCARLLLLTWLVSMLEALPESLTMLRLFFCATIEIPCYFCEFLSSSSSALTTSLITLCYIVTGVVGFFPLVGILFSYSQIVSSVLKISTEGGKYKVFSTCGSHLSAIFLFYRTCLGIYLGSTSTHASRVGTFASVPYTMITSMMNSFIYSLRNRDMKRASRKQLYSESSSQ
uniref:G-protein coupled receptors family 1 profile domain-containing protein n=1 Tax=Loxodonta africana TaxID=9785 RepID=G3U1A4_LOXAF